MGLLSVILSVIFMKGGVVRESEYEFFCQLFSTLALTLLPELCLVCVLGRRPDLEHSEETPREPWVSQRPRAV